MRTLKSFFRSVVLVITLLLFSFSSFYVQAKPKKLALIIAVANYPREEGWTAISSDNDVALVKNSLLAQGFAAEDITVIVDSQARKEGIRSAFNALIEKAGSGDIVVIHYSGHGQQIYDNNRDEVDGYDESIIPYDAGLYFKKGVYEGERHYRDEELGEILDLLRQKVGPKGDVLVILDSCHSGTATRGLGKSRGTDIKLAPPDYEPVRGTGTGSSFFEEPSRGAGEPQLAPMVVISGAGQDQLNYEYYDPQAEKNYGSLSYAFSKQMTAATKDDTYRGLFDKIKVEMSMIAPRQTPQVEGDVDRMILGGDAVDQKHYYRVKDVINAKTITIDAGKLMGIYSQTTIELYPVNTSDPSNAAPIAKGIVVFSDFIESDVTLDRELSDEEAQNAWVFIKDQNFGNMNVRVKVDVSKNRKLEERILAALSSMPTVEVVEDNPELLVEMNDATRGTDLHIITKDELTIYQTEVKSSNEDEELEAINDHIKNFAQANLLRKVELEDRNLQVTFEIIPVTVQQVGSRYQVDKVLSLSSKMTEGNEIQFHDGDCFQLRILNLGYLPAYYQVIDIQPDNQVGLLIPSGSRTPGEYRIYPGETTVLDEIFIFGEPYGTEVFKLIATEEVLNLDGIITTRGEVDEPETPFEQLFAESFKQTRAGTLSVPPSSANIFSVPVKIVP